LDERKSDIIRYVVLYFIDKNAKYLSDKSQLEDPWINTASSEVISLAVLHDFFSLKTIEFRDIQMKYGFYYYDFSESYVNDMKGSLEDFAKFGDEFEHFENLNVYNSIKKKRGPSYRFSRHSTYFLS